MPRSRRRSSDETRLCARLHRLATRAAGSDPDPHPAVRCPKPAAGWETNRWHGSSSAPRINGRMPAPTDTAGAVWPSTASMEPPCGSRTPTRTAPASATPVAATAATAAIRIRFVTAAHHICLALLGYVFAAPGAIPKRLRKLREDLKRFILPPRRSGRSSPRAVKVKMSSYPKKRRPLVKQNSSKRAKGSPKSAK